MGFKLTFEQGNTGGGANFNGDVVPNRGGSVAEGSSAKLGGASGNGKKLLA